MYGLGWSVDFPMIQRKTDKKLPRYRDASEKDIFIFSGAEDLVPYLNEETLQPIEIEENGLIIHQYRPRIEGGFARIERITQEENNRVYWKVTSGDNITTFFGISQKVNNLGVHSIMLFTAAQELTITVLKSAELDTLDTESATFAADLSLGAAMGQLQQYIVTDQEEDLNGFWGLQFDQNEIVADELKNSWLVIKYQLEIEM